MAQLVEANNHSIDVVAFRKQLAVWGQDHFRPFPWRQTKNPYRILIAEILLHRTQAKQVAPVYQMLTRKYPRLAALDKASKRDLLQLLYPLGLRWRVDLIRSMVRELCLLKKSILS